MQSDPPKNSTPFAAVAIFELIAVPLVEVPFCPSRRRLLLSLLLEVLLPGHLETCCPCLLHVFGDLLEVFSPDAVYDLPFLKHRGAPYLFVRYVQASRGWAVAKHRVSKHWDSPFDIGYEFLQLFAFASRQAPHFLKITNIASSWHQLLLGSIAL